MDRDRNQIFAALAAGRRYIDDAQLAEARTLAEGADAPIPDLLVERGWISAEQRSELDTLVDAELADGPGLGGPPGTDATVAFDPGASGLGVPTLQGPEAGPAPPAGGPGETVATLPEGPEASGFGGEPDPAVETIAADQVGAPPSQGSPPPPAFGPVRVGPGRAPAPGAGRQTRGHLTLDHVHARGGIGQVWLAFDPIVGRQVALKELRHEHGNNAMALSRFLREARVTGQLEHPGVVPVYSLEKPSPDEPAYYTMRFIRGRTLSEAIQSYHAPAPGGVKPGRVELVALLQAFAAACQAIAYAHARGVIHRDLKGDNIVLGDFGEVMVLDWGLAKTRDDTPEEPAAGAGQSPPVMAEAGDGFATVDGQVVGTPAYMPPEQAEGRVDRVDHRSDIYSLGAILFEILAGRPPYTGSTTLELLHKVRSEDPPRPRAIRPDAPRALEAVCLRAIRREPDERYQSAGELAREVLRWLADEPVSAYREPAAVRLARWARRHRTAVVGSAALLLAAFVALGVGTYFIALERFEAQTQREQARRAVNAMYTEVAEKWLEGRLDRVQRAFLERALSYYEEFAGDGSSDPRVRQERGRALRSAGDIRRKLGRSGDAGDAYLKSLAVFEGLAASRPADTEFRHDLAATQARLGLLQFALGRFFEAESALTRAVSIQERLVREVPGSPKYRLHLARGLYGRAEARRNLGRADEAESDYRRAIDLLEALVAEAPDDPEPPQDLAFALDSLGSSLADRGQDAEAEAQYRRALELFGSLVAQEPTNPMFREGRAKAATNLAILRQKAGDASAADRLFEQAQADYDRLGEDFPGRPDYRRYRARGHMNLGVLRQGAGRLPEAEAQYRKAADLYEVVVGENPEVPLYRRDLGTTFSNLGTLLAGRGAPAEAEAAYRRSVEIRRELANRWPEVPNYRNELAASAVNLGQTLRALGRPDDARAAYDEAITLGRRLATEYPDVPDYRTTLARTLNNLGTLLGARERPDEAGSAYAEARDLYEALLKAQPGLPEYRRSLASTLNNLGQLGGDDAEAALDRAVELGEGLVAESPEVPQYARELATARANLGMLAEDAGRDDDARAQYLRAAELAEGPASAEGAAPGAISLAANLLDMLGQLELRTGRASEAASASDRALKFLRPAAADPKLAALRPRLRAALLARAEAALAIEDLAAAVERVDEALAADPGGRVDAARVLAGASKLAGADETLAEPERNARAESLASRAVELLREAAAAKDPALNRVESDTAFDPIRDRDDFRSVSKSAAGP